MKKISLLIILLGLSIQAEAQSKHKKSKKVSYAKGTLFGYWGYNRSAYTKSDLRLVGPGYDFTLKDATAHDNPSPIDLKVYLDFKRITVPQFNARVGYYFKDHYAINFGYDHMKYIFDDGNKVLLDGHIDAGIDTVWAGDYSDQPVVTNRENFHYENSNGLNYLHFEVMRTDQWLRTRNQKFAISTSYGIGAGGLLSFNDFNFAQRFDRVTISMSGFALSAHASARFEFFNHVFLQAEVSGGFMDQLRVRTRPNDRSAYAKQVYGYTMVNTVIGFFLYLRPINGCNDCPNW
jgi:hypothetical protein